MDTPTSFLQAFEEGVSGIEASVTDYKFSDSGYLLSSNGYTQANDMRYDKKGQPQPFVFHTADGQTLTTPYRKVYQGWKEAYSFPQGAEESYTKDEGGEMLHSSAANADQRSTLRESSWQDWFDLNHIVQKIVVSAASHELSYKDMWSYLFKWMNTAKEQGKLDFEFILLPEEVQIIKNAWRQIDRQGLSQFQSNMENYLQRVDSEGNSIDDFNMYFTRPDVGDAELLRTPFPMVTLPGGQVVKDGWNVDDILWPGEQERLSAERKLNYSAYELYGTSTDNETKKTQWFNNTDNFDRIKNSKVIAEEKVTEWLHSITGKLESLPYLLGVSCYLDTLQKNVAIYFQDVFPDVSTNAAVLQARLYHADNRVVFFLEEKGWMSIKHYQEEDRYTMVEHKGRVGLPMVRANSARITKSAWLKAKLYLTQILLTQHEQSEKEAINLTFAHLDKEGKPIRNQGQTQAFLPTREGARIINTTPRSFIKRWGREAQQEAGETTEAVVKKLISFKIRKHEHDVKTAYAYLYKQLTKGN